MNPADPMTWNGLDLAARILKAQRDGRLHEELGRLLIAVAAELPARDEDEGDDSDLDERDRRFRAELQTIREALGLSIDTNHCEVLDAAREAKRAMTEAEALCTWMSSCRVKPPTHSAGMHACQGAKAEIEHLDAEVKRLTRERDEARALSDAIARPLLKIPPKT